MQRADTTPPCQTTSLRNTRPSQRHWASFALVLLLSATPASAQFVDPDAFPFGEVSLPESGKICRDSLTISGMPAKPTYISFSLVATQAEHIGQSVDIFVGFRMRNQPEKLWLLTRRDTLEWREYTLGKEPNAYYAQTPNSLQGLDSLTILSSDAPTDLSSLAIPGEQGELLIGYGLRTDSSATVSDAFQEMLDNLRFAVVWRVGNYSSVSTVCFEYNKIKVEVNFSAYPASGQ